MSGHSLNEIVDFARNLLSVAIGRGRRFPYIAQRAGGAIVGMAFSREWITIHRDPFWHSSRSECPHKGACNDQCATAFRIVPAELALYRHLGIPLPRLCPSCRHFDRMRQRNPYQLWHRKCQCAGDASANGAYHNTAKHFHAAGGACSNEFETSYKPERPEIIYCEQCYQAEVS